MEFDPSRLRRGEVIAGASALLLLVFLLFFRWYGVSAFLAQTASSSSPTSFTGWDSLTNLRWLLLLTILAALALTFLQATQRAPALPVSLSVIVTVLGLITVLALIYRVVINVPGPDDLLEQKPGAWLGLASAIGILYGGYASMRQEGVQPRDARTEIETIRLRSERGS
jgi:cytochrome b561